ncbi:MAG TPA: biotin/lipoate A/B protein ligase family protein [Gemmatimonadaceae bacterium]|nr:biotin/lipoate A/B protein ligase family protein [Gemmatimonadaceae bacterium]
MITPARAGHENMAIDEALLDRARTSGEAVLRVYAWSRPTLSFGRHQRARGIWEPERARGMGVDFVRRPTGGRALLHHHEITYSVSAPVQPGTSARASYDAINRLLLDGLARLGVAASLAAPSVRAALPDAAPCFERPALGEIVVNDRKLIGSAQWRERDAYLQHGSILLDDDQALVRTLAGNGVPEAALAATLRDALGRAPELDEVAGTLVDAVRDRIDSGLEPIDFSEIPRDHFERLDEHYRDDDWTWRR